VITAGETSRIVHVFIEDATSPTGAGLTGLVYNSAGLSAYYNRSNASSAVAISLATMTAGTWASGGFKEVDATNLPGVYQLGLPDAALASGARSCLVQLKGAANMVPCELVIDLTTLDVTTGVAAQVLNALMSAHNTADTIGAALQNQYDADIDPRVSDVEAIDGWGVRFFKNGVALTSGVTSPTLTVKERSSGSTLISAVTLTAAGSAGDYYYAAEAAERMSKGVEYEATVTATIGGASRSVTRLVGRDV